MNNLLNILSSCNDDGYNSIRLLGLNPQKCKIITTIEELRNISEPEIVVESSTIGNNSAQLNYEALLNTSGNIRFIKRDSVVIMQKDLITRFYNLINRLYSTEMSSLPLKDLRIDFDSKMGMLLGGKDFKTLFTKDYINGIVIHPDNCITTQIFIFMKIMR